MKLNLRQQQILEKVNRDGQIKVSEIAKELFFSEMTIRRDLVLMEKEGLLRRIHGGAIQNLTDYQYPVDYRMSINKAQKKELADKASRYLKDGQVIFFNSSSTLTYILPYLLKYKNLQIITNSVYLLHQLSGMHIPCFLTGGKYNDIERCLSGRQSEEFLKSVNPDIAFLSCEALSDDGIVTDSDAELAEIARIAVQNSKSAVLLMDRSKVGNLCTYTVCRTDRFDGVIIF